MNINLLSLILLFVVTTVNATEILKLDGKPLAIDLKVGEERIIDFGDHIQFKKGEVGPYLSGAFSLQGKLFLTAKRPFPIKRMFVAYTSSGKQVVLDVSATSNGSTLGDVVVTSSSNVKQQPASDEVGGENDQKGLGPVDLFRYASVDSFAPDRLKIIDHRFSPQKVNSRLDLSELFIGQSYGLYDAKIIKAWHVQGDYLTVIAVRNKSLIPRQLNLFDLNVDATLASPQHINLAQRDVVGDSTRIYVLTKRPFDKALGQTPLIIGS